MTCIFRRSQRSLSEPDLAGRTILIRTLGAHKLIRVTTTSRRLDQYGRRLLDLASADNPFILDEAEAEDAGTCSDNEEDEQEDGTYDGFYVNDDIVD